MATAKHDSTLYRKLALIIANERYQSGSNLTFATKNAEDMKNVLENINFDVTRIFNVNKHDMFNGIIDFSNKIKAGDMVLFYFCGYVYQVQDQRYLLPTNDANITEDDDFEDFAINFERTVLSKIVKKNSKFVTVFILDYCSPYQLTKASTDDLNGRNLGLSEMRPLPETFIQYACAANQTDGILLQSNRESLFTKHLLQNIVEKNVPIAEMFQHVSEGVYRESNRKQRPLSMNGLRTHCQVSLNEVVKARLRTEDYLIDEPLTQNENHHYSKCKDYYQCTGKPLISIDDNVLRSGTATDSVVLKFGIDENCNRFDLQNYIDQFCSHANLSSDDLMVQKVQRGSAIVTVGFSDQIESNDRKRCLHLIYKSCTDDLPNQLGKIKTFFLFMGPEKSLEKMLKHQAEIKLHPQFNRVFVSGRDFWVGPLRDGKDRGNMPYYCPVGWTRWSFYVSDNFDQKFRGWCICYHGTKFEYGLSILLNGLKPAEVDALGAGIYASPSIHYAAHPRYAEVKQIPSTVRKMFQSGEYIQYVLECRVHPSNIKVVGDQTLGVKTRIDPNFGNHEIEWVIDSKNKSIADFNDPNSPIVCTGLMIRITDRHPCSLPECKWWYSSHVCEGRPRCCRLGIGLTDYYALRSNSSCNIIYDNGS